MPTREKRPIRQKMSLKQDKKLIEKYKQKYGKFWYQLTLWDEPGFLAHAIGYLERDNIPYQWKQHPKDKRLSAIWTKGRTFEENLKRYV